MIVVMQCKDQVGLVAAVTGVLAAAGQNIVSLREHVDKAGNRFFMRIEMEQDGNGPELELQLQAVLPEGALITVNPLPQKKIVVLVTKEYHCLADILVRQHFSTLGAAVACVVSHSQVLGDILHAF